MQRRLAKLLLGALLALPCVYAPLALSSPLSTEESVPLIHDILDGPVPNDRYSVEITAAELFQLGLAKDAELLESYGARRTYLHLLNRPYMPAATVREALQQEASAHISLDQLSAEFMREGYSIQIDTTVDRDGPDRNMVANRYPSAVAKLMLLRPGVWALFDLPKTHAAGHAIGDAATLFIRMQIRNQTVESEAFSLHFPIGGNVPMTCHFHEVAPSATAQTYCEVGLLGHEPQVKERIIGTITAMLDGQPLAPVGTYDVDSESYPNRVSSWVSPWPRSPEERFGGDAWVTAQHNIAGAGCQRLGTCRTVFSGFMANGGLWGLVVTAAIMILTLYLRWSGELGDGRVFSWLFWCYFVMVGVTGFLFYVDPPVTGISTATGTYNGILSSIATAILSMPWSYFMSALRDAVPYRGLRDMGQHDFVRQWGFIFINLTYWGLMAHLRRARHS